MKQEQDLLDYYRWTDDVATLTKQIQELEKDIQEIYDICDYSNLRDSTLDALAVESHNLRIQKYTLELKRNVLQNRIIKFDLEEELSE